MQKTKKLLACCMALFAIMSSMNLVACSDSETQSEETQSEETHIHTGVHSCSCGVVFGDSWRNFIQEYGTDGKIGLGGDFGVLLTTDDTYDCILYAITDDDGKDERSLTLTYNAYDKKWSWLFDFVDGLGQAYGSFSEWSSRSASIPCTYKNDVLQILYTSSELLDEIKTLYNEIVNAANSKLAENNADFTMAHLGLKV